MESGRRKKRSPAPFQKDRGPASRAGLKGSAQRPGRAGPAAPPGPGKLCRVKPGLGPGLGGAFAASAPAQKALPAAEQPPGESGEVTDTPLAPQRTPRPPPYSPQAHSRPPPHRLSQAEHPQGSGQGLPLGPPSTRRREGRPERGAAGGPGLHHGPNRRGRSLAHLLANPPSWRGRGLRKGAGQRESAAPPPARARPRGFGGKGARQGRLSRGRAGVPVRVTAVTEVGKRRGEIQSYLGLLDREKFFPSTLPW